MANQRRTSWDRFMRASHLYTGLFLMPWMVVYAVSAFCLNHQEWFAEPRWEVVREEPFSADQTVSQAPKGQAQAILKHLDLEGPHHIQEPSDPNRMILWRPCVRGYYRITWDRQPSRLVVEQRGAGSFYTLLNNLHFQHGYERQFKYFAWAAIVDAVTISTVIWVISGIYLWARRPRKRLLGGLCAILGTVLFVGLVVLLCR
jgi:hypothetical protein